MQPLVSVEHRLVEQPAGLLASDGHEGWMVVRSVPAEERSIGRRLAAIGVPHLTVMSATVRRYSRSRSRRSERAFLPGHWFARWPAGHHDLFDRLRPTGVGILQVPQGGGPRFVAELRDFVRVILAGGTLDEPSLALGDQVEVIAGTLAGCRGRVVAQGKSWRLRVELALLGTIVTTAIDPGCVQRLPNP